MNKYIIQGIVSIIIAMLIIIGVIFIVHSYVDKIIADTQVKADEVLVDSLETANEELVIELKSIDSLKNEKVIEVKALDNDSTLKLFYQLIGKE